MHERFAPCVVPLQHFSPRPEELHQSSQGCVQCTEVHSLEVCSSSLPVQRQGDGEALGSTQPICCCLADCWNSMEQKASHGISHAFSMPGALPAFQTGKASLRAVRLSQSTARVPLQGCDSLSMDTPSKGLSILLGAEWTNPFHLRWICFANVVLNMLPRNGPFLGAFLQHLGHPVPQAGHEWRVTWKASAPWIATAQIPHVRSSVTYVPFVPNSTGSYFSSEGRFWM